MVLQAVTLLSKPLKELTRPNELSRQYAQSEGDRQPSGPRCDEHHDTEREQGEPEDYLQEALRLLKRLK